jgi:hypothetical protein
MSTASILALLLFAPGQSPEAKSPPAAAQAADPLEERYALVQRDFNQAISLWQKALEEARKAGVERKDWPIAPHPQFWERYAELVRSGHLQASIWCLSAGANLGERRAPDAAIVDLALARVWQESIAADKALAEGTLDANSIAARYPVKEYLRLLRAQTMVIGSERTLELYEQCARQSTTRGSIALALLSKASFIGTRESGFPEPQPVVIEIYRDLAEHYADTDSGQRAKGRLFRHERLQVGMQVPDFETEDVEGQPFKLSDYAGKVVVLDFWGFW